VPEGEVVAIIEASMRGFPFDAVFAERVDARLLKMMREEAERGASAGYARLDRQLELVRRELENALEADRRFRLLRSRASRRKSDRDLYHPWSHNASLADGVSAIYTGLESVLEAIGKETDAYTPRGDTSHAEIVDGMAVAVAGVRPALLSEPTRELMHEARKSRHVVRHKYALHLKRRDVAKNLATIKKLVPAFERDYRRFAAHMLTERAS
jgi:hypothetical protein